MMWVSHYVFGCKLPAAPSSLQALEANNSLVKTRRAPDGTKSGYRLRTTSADCRPCVMTGSVRSAKEHSGRRAEAGQELEQTP